MTNKRTSNKWIYAAYHEFAKYGPDFSLKALSTKTDLPRTTFYYHFTNKEDLIDELLQNHISIIGMFQAELCKIEHLIPDLYEILYPHKVSLMFHRQLLQHSHIAMYKELYDFGNNETIKNILPQIKAYFGFDYSDEEIFKFYKTLTDAWYAKLDFTHFSVKSMIALAEEIMDNILRLTHPEMNKR